MQEREWAVWDSRVLGSVSDGSAATPVKRERIDSSTGKGCTDLHYLTVSSLSSLTYTILHYLTLTYTDLQCPSFLLFAKNCIFCLVQKIFKNPFFKNSDALTKLRAADSHNFINPLLKI